MSTSRGNTSSPGRGSSGTARRSRS
jgi:hypothetical protein